MFNSRGIQRARDLAAQHAELAVQAVSNFSLLIFHPCREEMLMGSALRCVIFQSKVLVLHQHTSRLLGMNEVSQVSLGHARVELIA